MTTATGPRALSLHRGRSEPLGDTPGKRSGIRKTPVDGPVAIGRLGVEGDAVVATQYHGGPFKALCCYASEYYTLWKERTGVTMPLGSFGENLALAGLLDHEVCIGDEYRLGATVRVQVAGPRVPCGNLATHWRCPGFNLTVKRERKTGFYVSVLEPGTASAGDTLTLEQRPHPDWNLVRFWEALEQADPGTLAWLAGLEFLDPDWQPKFRR